MSKKVDLKNIVSKIEEVARSRMKEQEVVSLDQFRGVSKKEEPEDDASVRRSLEKTFKKEGYKVLSVEDGTHLNKVIDEPIDFIILDIGLPWLNGYELAELLKESDDLKDIPMIFLSGHTEAEDVKRGFAVGADDYIKKPFDVEKLKKTVKTLLSLRKDDPA